MSLGAIGTFYHLLSTTKYYIKFEPCIRLQPLLDRWRRVPAHEGINTVHEQLGCKSKLIKPAAADDDDDDDDDYNKNNDDDDYQASPPECFYSGPAPSLSPSY